MTPDTPIPTVEEFRNAVREAFQFVATHGFIEVPPQRLPDDSFQIWFRRGDEFIVIKGEGWGDSASVDLEHASGLELAVIYLVPPTSRPAKPKQGWRSVSQLDQVREQASWLEVHGSDFLRGDLARFRGLAKPLPPYKRRPTNAA